VLMDIFAGRVLVLLGIVAKGGLVTFPAMSVGDFRHVMAWYNSDIFLVGLYGLFG